MLEKMLMPQLGESVTEGTIDRWNVQVGDTINEYEPLAEVTTDKVTADIPSSFTGIVHEILVEENETVSVGTPICTIKTDKSEEAPETPVEIAPETPKEEAIKIEGNQKKLSNKARYSPVVFRLAEENNLDLQSIKGSGLGGRITRKDVLAVLNNPPKEKTVPQQRAESVEQTTIKEPSPTVKTAQGDIEIPVSAVRKTIAKRMTDSVQQIPHAWMMVEVDVSELVRYRNAQKEAFKQKEGVSLTYFAFFVKAVAQALKEYPQLNSVWNGDTIIQKQAINLSIAVATESELFVPVIKHADELSIAGIAKKIDALAQKVRTGALKADDMAGGTFTVNNTGTFGSVSSAGIINAPQAAILQIESIVKRPVIMHDNMFAARDIVNLCLSLDHRILDGFICGKFLARVKEILENISKETTSIY